MNLKQKKNTTTLKTTLFKKLLNLVIWSVVFVFMGALQWRYHQSQVIGISPDIFSEEAISGLKKDRKILIETQKPKKVVQFLSLSHIDSVVIAANVNRQSIDIPTESYEINLNLADSITLESLPGIGPYTARKIISYREKLGGFISKFQLLEINRIDSQLIDHPKIIWSRPLLPYRKINTHSPDIKTLYKHPYIGKQKAQNIMEYIKIRGKLTRENFMEMRSFDSIEKQRLLPYFDF